MIIWHAKNSIKIDLIPLAAVLAEIIEARRRCGVGDDDDVVDVAMFGLTFMQIDMRSNHAGPVFFWGGGGL